MQHIATTTNPKSLKEKKDTVLELMNGTINFDLLLWETTEGLLAAFFNNKPSFVGCQHTSLSSGRFQKRWFNSKINLPPAVWNLLSGKMGGPLDCKCRKKTTKIIALCRKVLLEHAYQDLAQACKHKKAPDFRPEPLKRTERWTNS